MHACVHVYVNAHASVCVCVHVRAYPPHYTMLYFCHALPLMSRDAVVCGFLHSFVCTGLQRHSLPWLAVALCSVLYWLVVALLCFVLACSGTLLCTGL